MLNNDETIYREILNNYLKTYNVTVEKWLKSLNGTSESDFESTVKIPYPKTAYKFLIGLHEIGHIVHGRSRHSYLTEYRAERFAITIGEAYNIKCKKYVEDAKHYVFKHLIYELNNNLLSYDNIDETVLQWLDINIEDIKCKTLHYAKIKFKSFN